MRILGQVFSGRRVAVLLGIAAAAVLGGGVSSASAALFPQCPPVGLNDGCQILITVDSNGNGSVAEDPNPPNNGPYDGSDDTLIGIQNNAQGNVSSVDLTSTTQPIFGFDGDGLCSASPQPPGCPTTGGFGPTDYEGPNNTFSNISADSMSGTVNFTNPVGPGGSAYWALEERLTAADVHLGNIAVQGVQCGSTDITAVNYKPKKSLTPTVPGVRAFINVTKPSQVQVDASLSPAGGKAGSAKSANLGTFSFHDPGRKKLRIALSKSLRNDFSIGDRVILDLSVKTTPDSAPACASKASKTVSLHTRVVHVLKSEAQ